MSHNKRNPKLATPGFGKTDLAAGSIYSPFKQIADRKQVLLTAIPVSKQWRMKAVSGDESIYLPGIFRNRLEALGACVLLARQCGGEVVP
jgi:hypothetical protein